MLNNTKLVKVFCSGLPQGELGDKERAASAAAIQGFVPKVSLPIASHMTIHSPSLKESVHNDLLRNRSSNIRSNDNNMLCIAVLFVGQGRASREGGGVMNLSGASSFNLGVANQGTSKRDNPPLSVPKDGNRREIAALSNHQVQESQFYCRNRRNSPENQRKNRRKIAAISWGAEQKSQRFRVCKIAAFSGC